MATRKAPTRAKKKATKKKATPKTTAVATTTKKKRAKRKVTKKKAAQQRAARDEVAGKTPGRDKDGKFTKGNDIGAQFEEGNQAGVGYGAPSLYTVEKGEKVIEVMRSGGGIFEAAAEVGVSHQTLYKWSEAQPIFREQLDIARTASTGWWEKQARRGVFTQSGAAGETFSATITMFMLKNKAPDHYRDKQEMAHSGAAIDDFFNGIRDTMAKVRELPPGQAFSAGAAAIGLTGMPEIPG